MKKHVNYLLAASVFVLMLILLYGGSIVLAAVVSLFGLFLRGGEGLSAGYWFLLDHMNLVSCVIYTVPAVAFILWYWLEVVRRDGAASFARAQTKKITPAGILWTLVLAYAVQHAVSIIIGFLAFMLPETVAAYEEMVESAGLTDYSLTWVFAVVILPPLVEETVFRGLILHYLKKGGARFWAANLIQAVLFGIYHGNLVQGIYAFCIGVLLGYLAERYSSLVIPVMVHALFNFFGTLGVELESMILPEIVQMMLIYGCVPLTAILLVLIHYGVGEKRNVEHTEERNEP
ncbi:MAG TPA: CPBP family intramembrane metalloprotease [Candidatus Mediterraneibacter quadrami]|uniref:CPBP family intramembrane metalloprotease n=1 Tax=Candidatus Mediterraneibacter quadrami TaxID=2838684 RepID=A0A9D2U7I6_9FIRM|nr:CPBP family intramembrane metalloprotease [Candidatus Mediterraneibacter quadrami]